MDPIILAQQVQTLDASVKELTHTSKNLRTQISGLYKENNELKVQLQHQSDQLESQSKEISELTKQMGQLVELLKGDDFGANPGFVKRFQKLEERVEKALKWLDSNKFKAVGIGIAISVIATIITIIFAVAKAIVSIVEFGKHSNIIK